MARQRKGRPGRGGRVQDSSSRRDSTVGRQTPGKSKGGEVSGVDTTTPKGINGIALEAPSDGTTAVTAATMPVASASPSASASSPLTASPRRPPTRDPTKEAELIRRLESSFRASEPQPGSIGHVVSSTWFARWCAWSGFRPPSAGRGGGRASVGTPSPGAPPPGPLSSSDLALVGGADEPGALPTAVAAELPRLRPGLIEGRDYTLLGDGAWRVLAAVHGVEGPDLARTYARVGLGAGRVELDPYELQLVVCWGEEVLGAGPEDTVRLLDDVRATGTRSADVAQTGTASEAVQRSLAVVTVSRLGTPLNLLQRAAAALRRDVSDCKILDASGGAEPRELSSMLKMLGSQGVKDRGLLWLRPKAPMRSAAVAVPANGAASLSAAAHAPASSAGALTPMFGLSSSPGFALGSLGGVPSFAAGSPASRGGGRPPTWAEDVRQTRNSDGRRGLAGLTNLGNTCFMASAVQCLAHTPPLLDVFARGRYKSMLNRENPLGLRGALAEAFGALVDGLWAPGVSAVAPRRFKWHLSRFAPQFAGYQQHDSQELLAFLLDGLHEDLNRVTDKPYFEDPDSNGVADAELAAVAWRNYRARNDSPIVDEFQGLLRSQLSCPLCGHVSVKFDPFMYLSLPLPSAKTRSVRVLAVAAPGRAPGAGSAATVGGSTSPGTRPPLELHAVTLAISATVGDLRQAVATSFSRDVPFVLALWTKPPRSALGSTAGGGSLRVLGDDTEPLDAVMETRTRPALSSLSFPSRFSPQPTLVAYLGVGAAGERATALREANGDAEAGELCSKTVGGTAGREAGAPRAANGAAGHERWAGTGHGAAGADATGCADGPIELQKPDGVDRPPTDCSVAPATSLVIVTHHCAAPLPPTLLRIPTSALCSLRTLAAEQHSAIEAGFVDLEGALAAALVPFGYPSPPDEACGMDVEAEADPGLGLDPPISLAPSHPTSVSSSLPSTRPPSRAFADASDSGPDISRPSSPSGAVSDDEASEMDSLLSPYPPASATGTTTVLSPQPETDGDPVGEAAHRHHLSSSSSSGLDAGSGPDSAPPPASRPHRLSPRRGDSVGGGIDGGRHCPPSRPAFELRLASVEGEPRSAASDPARSLTEAIEDETEPLRLVAIWRPDAAQRLGAQLAGRPPRAASAVAADATASRGPLPADLADCVRTFLEPERLDESESWYCARCKTHVRADKKLDLWSLPNVLVVHLKRFSYSRTSREKLSTLVRFPLKGLDLAGALRAGAPASETPSYDLFAVSNHYGALGGGHYTAFVQMPDDGEWYDFDDSSVSRMDAESVQTPAAYVLYYRRTGHTTDIGRILHEQAEYECSRAGERIEMEPAAGGAVGDRTEAGGEAGEEVGGEAGGEAGGPSRGRDVSEVAPETIASGDGTGAGAGDGIGDTGAGSGASSPRMLPSDENGPLVGSASLMLDTTPPKSSSLSYGDLVTTGMLPSFGLDLGGRAGHAQSPSDLGGPARLSRPSRETSPSTDFDMEDVNSDIC